MRAIMSVLPPAASGTTMVTGRVGQSSACAPPVPSSAYPRMPTTSLKKFRSTMAFARPSGIRSAHSQPASDVPSASAGLRHCELAEHVLQRDDVAILRIDIEEIGLVRTV